MKTNQHEPLSPTAVELLEIERRIEPAPEALMWRAMRRARSARDRTGVAAPSVTWLPRRLWVVAPVALGLAGLAAAAWLRWHDPPLDQPKVTEAERSISERPASQPQSAAGTTKGAALPVASTTASSIEAVPSASAVVQRVEFRTQELRLLDAARKATRNGDFGTVLSVVREHEQRFPRGHLLEEREALRVKALLGLGRNDEAKRAAEGFRKRFPQSVLLPSVERMVGASR